MLVSLSLGAQAQTQPQDTTMNRTVVVEQEYNPDIMDASKVNVLPRVEPPTVSKKAVEYDATLMPATQIPAGIMQAYTGKETQAKALPGYVRLGYGNYGNLDVRANYLFSLSPKDRLNLTFTMDGMDGKLDLPDNGGKWNSFYYRTHAAMDYVHAFSKVDLNIAGKFNQSNFNFLPDFVSNKQKFVSGDVHFGVSSTSDDMPLQFRAETNLLVYQRQHDLMVSNIKENIVLLFQHSNYTAMLIQTNCFFFVHCDCGNTGHHIKCHIFCKPQLFALNRANSFIAGHVCDAGQELYSSVPQKCFSSIVDTFTNNRQHSVFTYHFSTILKCSCQKYRGNIIKFLSIIFEHIHHIIRITKIKKLF